MNYQSVLIITYGRSGSTLLQGLLNSIDGCLVRGENNNLCYGLFQAYKSLIKSRSEFGVGDNCTTARSPWYGAASLDSATFLKDARRMVMHQLCAGVDGDIDCIGFKEIRYLPTDLSDFAAGGLYAYLDFLSELFPNPAFVVLTRDHDQVANSAWWKSKDPEVVKRRLDAFESEVAAYARDKSWIFDIRYEDMVERSARIPELFEFLGADYDADQVESVLSAEHSYKPKPKLGRSRRSRADEVNLSVVRELAHITLDNFDSALQAGKPFAISGVAILDEQISGDYSLVIRDGRGEHTVDWGLPSPWYGKKYADNPRAANARFVHDGVFIERGMPVDLYLVDGSGHYQSLAQISLANL